MRCAIACRKRVRSTSLSTNAAPRFEGDRQWYKIRLRLSLVQNQVSSSVKEAEIDRGSES
jgi:hypothetical protein